MEARPDHVRTAADAIRASRAALAKRREWFARNVEAAEAPIVPEPEPEPPRLVFTQPPAEPTQDKWCEETTEYSISTIQRVVCKAFGVSRFDLLSDRRDIVIARPRQLAMALCCKLTKRSTMEIGRRFNRDHTIVIHNRRRYAPMIEEAEKSCALDDALEKWVQTCIWLFSTVPLAHSKLARAGFVRIKIKAGA